ncbi:MAG: tRNA (adenosine(37)-N6)-dimethylallyltransferase MiaA [Coriobacteriia bacterium]
MTATSDSRLGRIVAVVGPTAVGKTAVAEEIASLVNGEIVSADSMQVYRGMDIGTAKPPVGERRAPYHCLDIVDPGEPYSAALFQRDAREAIDGIIARGRVPIVCGGSGLYVRAALDDMRFPDGEVRSAVREHLDALARDLSPQELHARLASIDPASAAVIHPANVKRIVRVLEMAGQGVSYAQRLPGFQRRESVYDAVFVGLSMDRPELYERIGERVDAMISSGLIEEVRGLLDRGFRTALTASKAIGYKEIVPVLEENADLPTAIDTIKQSTRRYAKRQLSWFHADPRVDWVDVTGLSPVSAVERVVMLVDF